MPVPATCTVPVTTFAVLQYCTYFPLIFISPVNFTRFSLRIYLHSEFSLEILGVGVASGYKCRMNLCLSSCSSPPCSWVGWEKTANRPDL